MALRNILSCIPLRSENSDKSEMISQVLYGEHVKLVQEKDNWIKVTCCWDGYEGWVAKEHELRPVLQTEGQLMLSRGVLALENKHVHLSPGSLLNENEQRAYSSSTSERPHSISEYAAQYLGSPYLWGGRSIWGIDCSGFTQVVLASQGISIPRDASQQVKEGSSVNFENRAKEDLAFFKSEKSGNITHVGIILEDLSIIHASGMVRIDQLDEEGIIRSSDGKRTHSLDQIRRYQ